MIRIPPRQGGWLEVICGPMFSGKSEEMIRRLRRAEIAGQRVVIFKHAFRNALIPYITAAGLALVEIFGIAVQTETVFGIYGLGSKISQAAQIQDAAVVLGLSSVVIVAATLMTLLVDFSYSVIDPRIRLDEGGMK